MSTYPQVLPLTHPSVHAPRDCRSGYRPKGTLPVFATWLKRSVSEDTRKCLLQKLPMKEIIYLINSRGSRGRTLGLEILILVKIPLVLPPLTREGPRQLSKSGPGQRLPLPMCPQMAQPRRTDAARPDHYPVHHYATLATLYPPPHPQRGPPPLLFSSFSPSPVILWGWEVKWERFLHRDAHFLSRLPPGWTGIKIREFNFAAKPLVLKEGPEGRKTPQGTRGPKRLPPRPTAIPPGG